MRASLILRKCRPRQVHALLQANTTRDRAVLSLFRIGCLMKWGSVSTPAPRRAVRNSSLCGAPDQASGPRRGRCSGFAGSLPSSAVGLAGCKPAPSRPSRAQCLLRRGLATRRASAPPPGTALMKWGSVRRLGLDQVVRNSSVHGAPARACVDIVQTSGQRGLTRPRSVGG